MKVLVTGATGFIGEAICTELFQNNFEVVQIGGLKSKSQKNISEIDAKRYHLDISEEKNLSEITSREMTEEATAVVHTAGLAHQFGDTKKEAFEAVNVVGTRNVTNLAVSLRAKHFILISSTAVYGIKPPKRNKTSGSLAEITFDEESAPNPQTLYAESKLEAENVCLEICEKNNLPLTVFRLAPVIGEANVGNVSRLISHIDGGRFLWIGKGDNLKTLVYKKDVARACVELLKNKEGGTEIFNLAAAPVKMKDFVDEIAAQLNKNIYDFSIPENILGIAFRINSKFFGSQKIARIENTIEKWLSDDVYSVEKINRKYGFAPATSVAEAVRRQVEWYKKVKAEK